MRKELTAADKARRRAAWAKAYPAQPSLVSQIGCETRSEQVNFRATPSTKKMAEALARVFGCSVADVMEHSLSLLNKSRRAGEEERIPFTVNVRRSLVADLRSEAENLSDQLGQRVTVDDLFDAALMQRSTRLE